MHRPRAALPFLPRYGASATLSAAASGTTGRRAPVRSDRWHGGVATPCACQLGLQEGRPRRPRPSPSWTSRRRGFAERVRRSLRTKTAAGWS
ncbi:hypothetical protein ACOMHN_013607 [Nucella lapillus]